MKKRNLIVVLLALVLIAGSFALPGAVLALGDAAIGARAEYVTMDEVELRLLSALTLEEKLALTGDPSTGFIPLPQDVGDYQTETEKEAFVAAGVVDDLFGYPRDWDCQEALPMMAVGGGRAFVLWRAVLVGEPYRVELLLDDETGKALGYTLTIDAGAGGWEFPDGPEGEWIDAEQYMHLAAFLLSQAELVPALLIHTDSGGQVTVTGSDLVVRITVTGVDSPVIRVNMS